MAKELYDKIQALLTSWQETGVPGRDTLHETADELMQWRADNHISGLWENPPRMLGATMDDEWGVGIEVILKYARVLGVETRMAGLRMSWGQIVEACSSFDADYVALTVLWFETEDDLVALREHLPERVKIIAGGPIFQSDPDFQQQAKVDSVAKDVADFILSLLKTTKRQIKG